MWLFKKKQLVSLYASTHEQFVEVSNSTSHDLKKHPPNRDTSKSYNEKMQF